MDPAPDFFFPDPWSADPDPHTVLIIIKGSNFSVVTLLKENIRYF